MSNDSNHTSFSRREMFGAVGKAVTAAAMTPVLRTAIPAHGRRRGAAERGCRSRSRDHPARQDVPARMGGIWRSASSRTAPWTAGRRTGAASSERTRADRRVEQGIRTGRGEVRGSQGAHHHRHLLGSGRVRSEADRRQRPDQELFDPERLGGNAAARQAARSRLHQELQDQQQVLECPRQGADRQLDSALHRHHQPQRCDARPGRHRQLHRSRQETARRTGGLSQRLRLLQRLGAPDRRGHEHRAHDRSAGRSRHHQGAREVPRHAGRLDSQDPRRAGTRWISADRVHAESRRRPRRRSSRAASSSTGIRRTAAITKATPPATSWNRPSITTR